MNNEAMNLAINQVAPAVADEIWNRAIEQAALLVDKDTRCDQAGYPFGPALEIRKLKK